MTRRLDELMEHPEWASRITVIDGPDGVGKSYWLKKIKEAFDANPKYTLITMRFPENYPGAAFRDLILSKQIEKVSAPQLLLFAADFLYGFETIIKPALSDPNTLIVIDRFLPSTCVYQGASLSYMNDLFKGHYPEFVDAFRRAEYIYLTPADDEVHRQRLLSKTSDEINHFDPTTEAQRRQQIRAYWNLSLEHASIGMLESYDVKTYAV